MHRKYTLLFSLSYQYPGIKLQQRWYNSQIVVYIMIKIRSELLAGTVLSIKDSVSKQLIFKNVVSTPKYITICIGREKIILNMRWPRQVTMV